MADTLTQEARSRLMSRIRGKGTAIDLKMEKLLAETGTKFEMYPKMTGNPDFASRRRRIAVFCDGDFWHGYRYAEKKKPASKYWRDKIERNMARDRYVTKRLRREGWSVLRFWEHDIHKDPGKCARRIRRKLDERRAVSRGA